MFSTFGIGNSRFEKGWRYRLILYSRLGAIIVIVLIDGFIYVFKMLDKDIYISNVQLKVFGFNINISTKTKERGSRKESRSNENDNK